MAKRTWNTLTSSSITMIERRDCSSVSEYAFDGLSLPMPYCVATLTSFVHDSRCARDSAVVKKAFSWASLRNTSQLLYCSSSVDDGSASFAAPGPNCTTSAACCSPVSSSVSPVSKS